MWPGAALWGHALLLRLGVSCGLGGEVAASCSRRPGMACAVVAVPRNSQSWVALGTTRGSCCCHSAPPVPTHCRCGYNNISMLCSHLLAARPVRLTGRVCWCAGAGAGVVCVVSCHTRRLRRIGGAAAPGTIPRYGHLGGQKRPPRAHARCPRLLTAHLPTFQHCPEEISLAGLCGVSRLPNSSTTVLSWDIVPNGCSSLCAGGSRGAVWRRRLRARHPRPPGLVGCVLACAGPALPPCGSNLVAAAPLLAGQCCTAWGLRDELTSTTARSLCILCVQRRPGGRGLTLRAPSSWAAACKARRWAPSTC